jgi:hypothetical protein
MAQGKICGMWVQPCLACCKGMHEPADLLLDCASQASVVLSVWLARHADLLAGKR